VALEKIFIGIPHDLILDLGDSKLQSYNCFNIELLKSRKMYIIFKIAECLKKIV